MGEFEREAEAYSSLQHLMEEAQKTKAMFVRAGLPIPATLWRMFGESKPSARGTEGAINVPPIEEPNRPAGVDQDWIWIAIPDAITITLVKAIMGRAGKALRPKEIVQQVQAIRPELSTGGVYNTAKYLVNADLLDRTDEGWALKGNPAVPILNGKYLWAPPDILQKQEVAAHRREAILHILKVFKTGLQILQIVEMLKRMTQCRAPVSKDLVKVDMEVMQDEKKVRKAGSSKKWVLA